MMYQSILKMCGCQWGLQKACRSLVRSYTPAMPHQSGQILIVPTHEFYFIFLLMLPETPPSIYREHINPFIHGNEMNGVKLEWTEHRPMANFRKPNGAHHSAAQRINNIFGFCRYTDVSDIAGQLAIEAPSPPTTGTLFAVQLLPSATLPLILLALCARSHPPTQLYTIIQCSVATTTFHLPPSAISLQRNFPTKPPIISASKWISFRFSSFLCAHVYHLPPSALGPIRYPFCVCVKSSVHHAICGKIR